MHELIWAVSVWNSPSILFSKHLVWHDKISHNIHASSPIWSRILYIECCWQSWYIRITGWIIWSRLSVYSTYYTRWIFTNCCKINALHIGVDSNKQVHLIFVEIFWSIWHHGNYLPKVYVRSARFTEILSKYLLLTSWWLILLKIIVCDFQLL
jgi:hypothetical protein